MLINIITTHSHRHKRIRKDYRGILNKTVTSQNIPPMFFTKYFLDFHPWFYNCIELIKWNTYCSLLPVFVTFENHRFPFSQKEERTFVFSSVSFNFMTSWLLLMFKYILRKKVLTTVKAKYAESQVRQFMLCCFCTTIFSQIHKSKFYHI